MSPACRTPCAARVPRGAAGQLHRAHRAKRHRKPLPLEVGHDQLEALVLAAEQRVIWNEGFLEGDRCEVSEAAQPSFFSLLALTPCPRSTMKNEIPWWPPSAVVLAAVTMKCARTPLVMYVFSPLTHPAALHSAVARVRSAATSQPASGSVIAERPDQLAADRGHQVIAASARLLPNFQIGGVAMFTCAPMPAAVPPRADSRELLDQHRLVQVVAALAAVLRRVLEAEQTLGGELRRKPRRGTIPRPPTAGRAGSARAQ